MAERNKLRTRILSIRRKLINSPSELSGFEYLAPGREPSASDIVKALCLEYSEYCVVGDLEGVVSREVARAAAGSRTMGVVPQENPVDVATPIQAAPSVGLKKRSRETDGSPSQVIGGSKVKSPVVPSAAPAERFGDICGLDQKCLLQLRNQVILPLTNPSLCNQFLRSMPCPGLLICGAPGSGKSLLARAIAGECGGATFFAISSTEIVAGISGESEERIRMIFEAAKLASPSIVVFDDIDVICPRSANRDLERRIVAQIQNCMDSLKSVEGFVSVIATTSKPELIDSSLRRSGRFDIEIALGMPDLLARRLILEKGINTYFTAPLAEDVDLDVVAKKAAGFVGADLMRLVREAGMCAVKKCIEGVRALGDQSMDEEGEGLCAEGQEGECGLGQPGCVSVVCQSDFLTALTFIEPSSRREGFSTVPAQTWEDVGSLDLVKARLEQAVCLPIRRADLFAKINRDTVMHGNDGVLLYGPPGCGKTLLAKAVANASGASFISVKGPELLNKYVGESERAVRQVFERARISPPCVIFFDELDALCPRRDSGGGSSSGATERVVNQMLTEMDGAGESNRGVIVIGATNRPDMVDPAMLRPGRLGLLIYVPLPDSVARANILRTLMRKTEHDSEKLDFDLIGTQTQRFSGADMACLVRSAVTQAVVRLDKHGADQPACVTVADFALARSSLNPSVSADEELRYLALRDSIDANSR